MEKSPLTVLADLMPRDEPAVCPECGGRLTTYVILHATVPVDVMIMDGEPRRFITVGTILDSKATLEERVEVGPLLNSADELRCSKCVYWRRVGDLGRDYEDSRPKGAASL
jgi:hypothetical protein